MSVSNISDALMENVLLTRKWKMHFNLESLGDTQKTLVVDDAPVQILDPEGTAVDVLLPAEASSKGLLFMIINNGSGTEDLVVKEDGDSTTIATVTASSASIVFCDGTTWRGFAATNVT
jgi:outer membrane lipoprotein-sorting protein